MFFCNKNTKVKEILVRKIRLRPVFGMAKHIADSSVLSWTWAIEHNSKPCNRRDRPDDNKSIIPEPYLKCDLRQNHPRTSRVREGQQVSAFALSPYHSRRTSCRPQQTNEDCDNFDHALPRLLGGLSRTVLGLDQIVLVQLC